MFEDNKYDPDIELLFDYLKDEESNPDTWNVFDNPEVDTKVDINKPIVTRSGRVFGFQEFNINQIEDTWFDKSNATYKEYNKVSADIIANIMCFYDDKFENMSEETQLLLLQNYSLKKGIKKSINR